MRDNLFVHESDSHLPEVLFEFVVHGNFVKVMAVDPITGIEISMVGDSRASKATLEKLATKKLIMVIKRNNTDQFRSAKNDNNQF